MADMGLMVPPMEARDEAKEVEAAEKKAKHDLAMEASQTAKAEKLAQKKANHEEKLRLIGERREAKKLKKEENIEKARVLAEERKAVKEEKQRERLLREQERAEQSKQKRGSVVVVALDQQALLDQIRVLAERNGGKVAKMNLISTANQSRVQLTFEHAEQAKAFLNSGAQGSDLLVKVAGTRPLAGSDETVHFPIPSKAADGDEEFEKYAEEFGDRDNALSLVKAALEAVGVQAMRHVCLKGERAVLEMDSADAAIAACEAVKAGPLAIGALGYVVPADECKTGNPPRPKARAKKRKMT